MAELPSGTVTFLFSDIEGSTRLLEARARPLPAAARPAPAHRAGRARRFGGHEVNTEGDSFFAVFPTRRRACRPRSPSSGRWPPSHGRTTSCSASGSACTPARALVVEDDYVGLDVHRAARIMAAAHGGQIARLRSTRALGAVSLGDGIELRDLGEHRLRDLSGAGAPVPGRRRRSGQPSSRRCARSTPRPTTCRRSRRPLVGRDDELRRIRAPPRSHGVRLLTLTGPGGIGKTRLALQVGGRRGRHAFPDGVYFVDLSPARDAAERARGPSSRPLGIRRRLGR